MNEEELKALVLEDRKKTKEKNVLEISNCFQNQMGVPPDVIDMSRYLAFGYLISHYYCSLDGYVFWVRPNFCTVQRIKHKFLGIIPYWERRYIEKPGQIWLTDRAEKVNVKV